MQLKKDSKYNVLVSGASGIVGYGILRSLNSYCNLIGTTIYDESPANCFADIVIKAPFTTSDNYIPWLIETIKKYNVDIIIPGIEADMSCWNRNREYISATGVTVMLNNHDLIELCLDKWAFYQKLKEKELNYCIYSTLDSTDSHLKFPFLLKPRCGYGSKGIITIESKEMLDKYKEEIGKKLMMQEIVGTSTEEYTISAFFDYKSELKAYISFKRKLSKMGYTEIAETVDLPDMHDILVDLARVFYPVGPTNFQFRKHDEEWKILEINPRISSSTSIKCAFGYNESKMCIDYFLNNVIIEQPKLKLGKAIRYTEDFIIYDCDNI